MRSGVSLWRVRNGDYIRIFRVGMMNKPEMCIRLASRLHLELVLLRIESLYGAVATQTEPEGGATPGPDAGPDADGERSCAQQARAEGDDRCRDGGKPRPGRD